MPVVVPGRGGEVDLVKVMEDAVDRVEDGPVRIVLGAAVLVHEVVRRRLWSSKPEGFGRELRAVKFPSSRHIDKGLGAEPARGTQAVGEYSRGWQIQWQW